MIKKFVNIYILIFISIYCSSDINASEQKNQNRFEISILSIGEGSSLADAFGHSGIRVIDLVKKTDLVFNFGVYDFDSPNFYSNFVKGRPKYKLDDQNYNNFVKNYIKEKRYVIEHHLNLDEKTTENIVYKLYKNLENPEYTYDYLRDNCATRVADIIIDNTNNKLKVDKIEHYENISFRMLIHNKINENSWAALGIDLCLGAIIDKQISIRETLFLPENLMGYLQEFENKKENRVTRKVIYSPLQQTSYIEKLPSPLNINLILSLLIIVTTFFNYKNNKWTKSIDLFISLFTGAIGLLIVYLWFFSDHFAAAQNFNLLWAFPINFGLILCIFKNKIPSWTIGYLKFLIILICLLFLHWITGVQKYNITLLSIFIALIIRYVFLIFHINKIIK